MTGPVVGDASLAEDVIESYVEQTKIEGVGYDQAEALYDVLHDGVVNHLEREQLRKVGFGDKFINALAGENGTAPLQARVKELAEEVERPLFGSKIAQRYKDAMELKKGIKTLRQAGIKVDPDTFEGVKELVEDLRDIIEDEDASSVEKLEAAEKLSKLGIPEATEAFFEITKDGPLMGVYGQQVMALMSNLPNEDRGVVIDFLVAYVEKGGSYYETAISVLGTVVERNAREKNFDYNVSWGIAKLKQFAKNDDFSIEARLRALKALARGGIISCRETLYEIQKNYPSPSYAYEQAQEALEELQRQIDGRYFRSDSPSESTS